jgi:hypothetical protein
MTEREAIIQPNRMTDDVCRKLTIRRDEEGSQVRKLARTITEFNSRENTEKADLHFRLPLIPSRRAH